MSATGTRGTGKRYDDFIDAYVTTATRMFPGALLHWEDFGPSNARRILEKYTGQICTFNDDMQGTGAIVLAAMLSAVKVSATPMREQRIVIFGAGTAGIGIADQLRDAMVRDGLDHDTATRRIWPIDKQGLLTDDMADLRDFQQRMPGRGTRSPAGRRTSTASRWPRSSSGSSRPCCWAPPPSTAPSPRRSCARWRRVWTVRSSSRSPTRPNGSRRCPPT